MMREFGPAGELHIAENKSCFARPGSEPLSAFRVLLDAIYIVKLIYIVKPRSALSYLYCQIAARYSP